MKSLTRWFAFVSLCFVVVCISLLASSAFAQGFSGLAGPGVTPNPTPPGGGTVGGLPNPTGPGVITNIKTAPLQAGDSITIPIDVHNPGPALPNWAGVLVEVHLLDPTEVDITAVRVGGVPVPHPFGPLSQSGPGSTIAVFTVFNPAAFQSGVTLQPSSAFPAISLDLIAKNTNPINNSDVDIGLRFADIYHQPDVTLFTFITNTGPSIHLPPANGTTIIPMTVPGSTTWRWEDSHRVFVPSHINGLPDLHLTVEGHLENSNFPFPNAPPTVDFDSKFAYPPPADPETGHFIHFPAGVWHKVTSVVSFHVLGGRPGSTMVAPGGIISTLTAFFPGSQIYAVPFLATATIGIEHIPEPAAPILLLGGVASLAFGFRARRRRQQHA